MVDLTKKKTLGEYDTDALANGDTVVTYRSTNAVGEKVFLGNIVAGTAASIAEGASTALKMYSDKSIKDAVNTGAIPIGTSTEIETGTDTTAKLYAPDQLNSAIKDIAVAQYAGRTAMKAITGLTAGDVVYLSEGGRSGQFIWTLGDFSAEVAADTLQGVYVASDTVEATVGCWVRKLDGYVTPEMFGAVGDGSDESVQIQGFMDFDGPGHIPSCPVYYKCGDITVPDNKVLTGEYIDDYTPFNLSDIIGKGGYLVYDTTKTSFITWGKDVYLEGLGFHGVNRSVPWSAGELRRLSFDRIGIFRFSTGFGRDSFASSNGCYGMRLHVCGNDIGISTLVDSRLTNVTINANEEDGLVFSEGSNDNTLSDLKIEWNNGHGIRSFGSNSSNQVTGVILDRNGKAGLSISGTPGIQVSQVKFRRNGRLSELDTENDAHMRLAYNGDGFQICNVETAAGGDDGGGSYVSPSRSIVATDQESIIGSIANADLTGCVSDEPVLTRNGGSLTIKSGVNLDFGDGVLESGSGTLSLESVSNIIDQLPQGTKTGVLSVSTAATTGDIVLSGLNNVSSIKTYSRRMFSVDMISRKTSTGGTTVNKWIIELKREGGNVTSNEYLVYQNNADIALTSSVTTDGDELTITIDPGAESYSNSLSLTYEV